MPEKTRSAHSLFHDQEAASSLSTEAASALLQRAEIAFNKLEMPISPLRCFRIASFHPDRINDE